MRIPITKINKNCSIFFDRGAFDNWCVYMISNNKKYAPKDIEYFNFFLSLAKAFPAEKIYSDFVKIYNKTEKFVNVDVLKLISRISKKYVGYEESVCLWFTIMYAGMIAEENKHGAILKKRIKRLGVYMLLIENLGVEYSANFSRGCNWRYLDTICSSYGF